MTKEEFIDKNMSIAIHLVDELAPMGYRKKFTELLEQYESSQGLVGMAKGNSMPITNVVEPSFDLQDVIDTLNESNPYFGSSSGKCMQFYSGSNNGYTDSCVYCGLSKLSHPNPYLGGNDSLKEAAEIKRNQKDYLTNLEEFKNSFPRFSELKKKHADEEMKKYNDILIENLSIWIKYQREKIQKSIQDGNMQGVTEAVAKEEAFNLVREFIYNFNKK